MTDDRTDVTWRLVVGATAVCVAILLAGLILGFAVPDADNPLSDRDDRPSTDADPLHVNPADVEREASLDGLARQLSSQLSNQVESGAFNLSQSDYDRAREQLGDERFEQLLDEYGTVAGETGDQSRYETLRRARQTQRDYTNYTAEYWELYQWYERLTSDETLVDDLPSRNPSRLQRQPLDLGLFDAPLSPRAVARQLEDRAQRTNESATATIEHYQNLSTSGGQEYADVVDLLSTSLAEIESTQTEVRHEQFVRTNLTVETTAARISPVDPLETAGRLTETDGTPLANRTVTLAVGESRQNVTTDDDGRFELTYRPIRLPANATTVDVVYLPESDSIYLDDETTIDVRVETATPVTNVTVEPPTVEFNETVRVTGTVTAGSAGVRDIPYLVVVDGDVAAQNATVADGRFASTFGLPANVETGEQPVAVRLSVEGRALTTDTARADMTVEAKQATLSVDAESAEQGTVSLSGELVAEGDAVPGQLVEFRIDDALAGTARTDVDGAFTQQVAVPDAADGDSIEIHASFDGEGTSFEAVNSTATTRVAAGSQTLPVSQRLFAVSVLAGALAVGGVLYRARRRRSAPSADTPESGRADLPTSDGDVRSGEVDESLLERAVTLLNDGRTGAAVGVGYVAFRQRLDGGHSRELTHWEFYREHRDRLDAEAATLLREVTDIYERVAFAGEPADETMVRDIIEAVQDVDERLNAGDEPLGADREHSE